MSDILLTYIGVAQMNMCKINKFKGAFGHLLFKSSRVQCVQMSYADVH
jgi:hypothetical protein